MWSVVCTYFVGFASRVMCQINVGTLYEIHVGMEPLVVLPFHQIA